MFLITKWFGVFLCDNKSIKEKILFPKNKKEIVKRLEKIDNKEILSEEKEIIKNKKVIVNEIRLRKIGNYNPKNSFFKEFEIKSEDFGFSNILLQKSTLVIIKDQVNSKLASEDLQLIQMVNTLDDLIQTSNLLHERFDCWSILPASLDRIQPLQNTINTVKNEMKKLETQIDLDMHDNAPNISKIVGSLIGARLISLAGGIERLASMPSSTIQLLGAEKALFRYKKEGGKPPKHGVIFQHPKINRNPKEMRGKIARIFASKISIAAKADAFTKRDISKDLKDELDKRIKDIKCITTKKENL
jgi:nucleolar protein 56